MTQLSGMLVHLCFTSISPQGVGRGVPKLPRSAAVRMEKTESHWERIIRRGRQSLAVEKEMFREPKGIPTFYGSTHCQNRVISKTADLLMTVALQ